MENNEAYQNFEVYIHNSSIQCLKKYAKKALSVLRAIQIKWEWYSNEQEIIFDSINCLNRVNSLFITYELLIIEFDEYCQALEIPDLGKTMLKIFVQMMQILKKMLTSFAKTYGNWKEYQDKDKKQKLPLNEKNKQFYTEMERTKYHAKYIDEGLASMEKYYEDDNVKQASLRLQKAFQKVTGIQNSNAEVLIHQSMIEISNKSESLKNFIKARNKVIKNQNIIQVNKISQIIKQQFLSQKNEQTEKAIKKIYQVLERFIVGRENAKKMNLVNFQIQTDPINLCQQEKNAFQQKINKQLKEINQLKISIQIEKNRGKNLQKLIREKTEGYEQILLKNKIQYIKREKQISFLQSKVDKECVPRTIENISKQGLSHISQNLILKESDDKKSDICEQNSVKADFLSGKLINTSEKKCQQNLSTNLFKRERKKLKTGKFRPFYKEKNNDAEIQSQKIITKEDNLVQDNHNQIQSSAFPLQKSKFEIQSNIYFLSLHNKPVNQFSVQQRHNSKNQQSLTIQKRRTLSVDPNKLNVQIEYKPSAEKLLKKQGMRDMFKNPPIMQKSSDLRKKKKKIIWGEIKKNKKQYSYGEQSQQIAEQDERKRVRTILSKKDLSKSHQRLAIMPSKPLNTQKDLLNLKDIQLKAKLRIPKLEDLHFLPKDIQSLFLQKKRAMDFQYLNFNQVSYRRQAESIDCLKSLRFLNLKRQRQKSKAQLNQTVKRQEYIWQLIFKQLNNIKNRDRKKYLQLQNFVRYPFSFLNKNMNEQRGWNQLCSGQDDMSLGQVKKVYQRLQNIHRKCEQKDKKLRICGHLINFLQKIGITFQ